MATFDKRKFRDALGTFSTGITVVTTTHNNSKPVGITVNSFTSVSLDPPLVLWCLDNDAESYNIYATCKNFAVHILHQDQEEISKLFATKYSSKFTNLEWHSGEFGSPILNDFFTCFQCETETTYAGGDHLILLGRVKSFETHKDRPPLVYHGGNYQALKT